MKILITGGTNGMGKGVAKVLAGADGQAHELIVLCRSRTLGEALIRELAETTGNRKVSIVLCDLTRLADVRRVIAELHERHAYLDGIFINAGIGYAAKRIETEDGLDSHFQVNYLSQFMLVLNLLDLLNKSENGGRVIFNATQMGEIEWDDLQGKQKWGYEPAIMQAMAAKRLFLTRLHRLHRERGDARLSFIGFQIPKTVWSNQLNIIPAFMRWMASLMRLFGKFISIEECGKIMAPLFTETQAESLKKSGQLMTWKKGEFLALDEVALVKDRAAQDLLWKLSLELCGDEATNRIAMQL